MKDKTNFKIGDSVIVKKEILDPDSNLHIGGWQGKILKIEEGEKGSALLCIEWDSVTLKNMPSSFIEQSEEEDLDYTKMYLETKEVELTESRDTQND